MVTGFSLYIYMVCVFYVFPAVVSGGCVCLALTEIIAVF